MLEGGRILGDFERRLQGRRSAGLERGSARKGRLGPGHLLGIWLWFGSASLADGKLFTGAGGKGAPSPHALAALGVSPMESSSFSTQETRGVVGIVRRTQDSSVLRVVHHSFEAKSSKLYT